MRNLKLTLSYDGTRYHGFSKPQPKGKKRKQEKPKSSDAAAPKTITPQNTISSKLAETISRLTGTPVELFCGAWRTRAFTDRQFPDRLPDSHGRIMPLLEPLPSAGYLHPHRHGSTGAVSCRLKRSCTSLRIPDFQRTGDGSVFAQVRAPCGKAA